MICKHCHTPTIPLYSDTDGPLAQCPKCGRAFPAAPFADTAAKTAAQQAFSGWSYLNNQYFDQAAEAFRKAVSLCDCVPYRWAALLADYGVRYIEEYSYQTGKNEYIVNFWKRDVPQTLLSDSAEFSALLSRASFLGAEYVACCRRDAEAIDHYLRQLLTLLDADEPCHIFISYKDIDARQRDTPEKLLMRRVAQLLSGRRVQGRPLNVFYAPVSLGEADRPVSDFGGYIHAALRSARLMVVIASDPAYPSSPWVESEWQRFLRWNPDSPDRLMTCAIAPMTASAFPGTLHKFQSRLCATAEEALQETTARWFAGEIGRRLEEILSETAPQPMPPKAVARFAKPRSTVPPPPPAEDLNDALYREGMRHLEAQDFSAAMDCFRTAAEHSHPAAMHRLGEGYLSGEGVEFSPQLAVFWLDKASRRGHAAATARLGECYLQGVGVPADPKRGQQLIRLAAEASRE